MDSPHPDPELASLLLHALPLAVIATDCGACITSMNAAAEALTGSRAAQLAGLRIDCALQLLGPDGGPGWESALLRCLRLHAAVAPAGECLLVTSDGRRLVIEESAVLLNGPDGAELGAVLLLRDVSDERRTRQQLSWRATHDALTGLVNRAEFESQLASACRAMTPGQEHSLLYLDLDRFKIINDSCGHGAGDALLQGLSAMLLTHMRGSDVLARLGGDELGVLLLNCSSGKARLVADGLRLGVKEFHFRWEGQTFQVGASIGISGVVADGAGAAEIMAQADAACYAAKHAGRDCIHVHHLSERALHARNGQLQWLPRLRDAIAGDRFCLFAMPVVALSGNHIDQQEILVRLPAGPDQMLLPGAFLPAAERYDMMASVDRWVIAAVCAHLQRMPAGQAIPCSVTLSQAAIDDPGVVAWIGECLVRYQVAQGALRFKIAESTLGAAPHAVHALVSRLYAMGCRFTLDRFGGAVSSFCHLKTLAIDYIKIDAILVRGTADDELSRVMVGAIHQLAHAMGVATVAGHVEDERILAAIGAIGIDYVQGHALGRARPLA